jgi:orotate phosphoribosyltransferase
MTPYPFDFGLLFDSSKLLNLRRNIFHLAPGSGYLFPRESQASVGEWYCNEDHPQHIKANSMAARMTNMTGARGAGGRVSTHRNDRLMLQTVAAPKPLANLSKEKARLLEIIKQKSFLKGTFKLASGATSNYYLDMKPTMFDPEGANLIADIVYELLRHEFDIDSIGGLELGAVPIISTVTARSWHGHPLAGFVVRKEKKGHGTDKHIDGNFTPNTNVILLDDVTTKGGSVMQAVEAVRARGGTVKKIITIVDRLEGAAEKLRQEGIDLIPIFKTPDILS